MVATHHYDAVGNQTQSRVDGDRGPGAGVGRLAETNVIFDAMNRATSSRVEHFVSTTGVAIGDGGSITGTEYGDNSQVFRVTDDNGNQSSSTYDTANRRLTATDARGNTVTYGYDANSNMTLITENELSDVPGAPAQLFTAVNTYDALDRMTSTRDNALNLIQYRYDSRGNRTRTIDARGNNTIYAYDGLSRSITTTRTLTDTGDGAGMIIGEIPTYQVWDDDSRLIAQMDANLNATRYAYDALNRKVVTRAADGTMEIVGFGPVVWPPGQLRPDLSSFVSGYDTHDNMLQSRDANFTVVAPAYDLLNRVTAKTITPGPGVLGTTSESFIYDGLGRTLTAEDNVSRVVRSYDSLSNVLTESQQMLAPPAPAAITASVYDGLGNQTCCTYPGGRVVARTYDVLNRVKQIREGPCPVPPAPPGGPLVTEYFYYGPARVHRKVFGNGTRCDYEYDNVRRTTRTRHYKPGALLARGGGDIEIDDREYDWDANYNKTARTDVRIGGPEFDHQYGYDSVDRLIRTQVDGLVPRDSNYVLDGVGNRCAVADASPPPAPECDYTANSTNEYTDLPGGETRAYDANGNTTSRTDGMGASAFHYDYRNLMVSSSLPGDSPTAYIYDVLGRRVYKQHGALTQRFLYDGWQELEERDSGGAVQATWVYGNYIDEVLQMARSSETYYYHSDDNFNVMTLTDSGGDVAERYEYDDYGASVDPDTGGALSGPPSFSPIFNPLLFTGRRFDVETEWYYYRSRLLDPDSGRFSTRDRLGIWFDRDGLGNAYLYVGASPFTFSDPTGTVKFIFKQLTGWFGNYGDPWGTGSGSFTKSKNKATSSVTITNNGFHDNGVCNTVGELAEVKGHDTAGLMALLVDDLPAGKYRFQLKLDATATSSFAKSGGSHAAFITADHKTLFNVSGSLKVSKEPMNTLEGENKVKTEWIKVTLAGGKPELVVFFKPTISASGRWKGVGRAVGTIEVLSYEDPNGKEIKIDSE